MRPTLTDLWRILPTIRSFTSTVASGPNSKTGWTGETNGTVEVQKSADGDQIDFIEKGTLTTAEGKTIATTNHWQWNRAENSIQLSHRRRDKPVLLAELKEPATGQSFHSPSPHLCGEDVYALNLEIAGTTLRLNWRITGPKKDERLVSVYKSEHN
jgi:hypothetical protein|tara:strand:- start:44143 stop:44610 length:468 start_codon:yes stop_codon:yes gene_type:complete